MQSNPFSPQKRLSSERNFKNVDEDWEGRSLHFCKYLYRILQKYSAAFKCEKPLAVNKKL